MLNDYNQDIEDDNNGLMVGVNQHLMSGDEGDKEMMRESNVDRNNDENNIGKTRDF